MTLLKKFRSSFVKRNKLVCGYFMETSSNESTVNFPSESDEKVVKTRKRLQVKHSNVKNKKFKTEVANANNMGDNSINNVLNSVENVILQTPPTKSQSDKKDYLAVKLRNGLQVLLISDVDNLIDLSEEPEKSESNCSDDGECSDKNSVNEECNESGCEDDECDDSSSDGEHKQDKPRDNKEKLAACSLTVGVGSFSDPEEIPGLAHFLEHMLFMGSTKYPKENDFDSYISTRGGSDNAATECEQTTFYFDCPEIHMEGALDRFSNLFISPLMKRDSISREREAIESEFKLSLSSDSSRLEQLFCSTAPLNNPAHKFMWGNLITLQENVKDDVLYDELRRFWARHYSAHRMTVAIQARLPMGTLLKWVDKYFGGIPNNNVPPDSFAITDTPFMMESFHKIYTVQPVKDKNKLQITWAFPPVINLYRSKPLMYLSYLIGHEGEGSLLSYLHENLWALTIVAGNGETGIESNSIYSLFSIDITLTEEGLANIEHVLCLVFRYIKLLQETGPEESIFREIQLIEDINFRFVEESDPSDYVEDLSQHMQLYPSEEYISGDQLLFEYNPEEIRNILNLMVPDKINIMISSKIAAAKVQLDKVEPWFSTKYNLRDIPEEWLNTWLTSEPHPHFHLPDPNPYIASDFTLLPIPDNQSEYPEQIMKDERIETWHKQDTKFRLPHGYINVYMISPIASVLPQNNVMCSLIVSLFKLIVVKEVYPASVARLNYKLQVADNGLILTVAGYHDKLPLFLDQILTRFTTFNCKINSSIFEAVKEETRKRYFNLILKPGALATDLRLSILCKPFWPSTVKLHTLPYITLDKFKSFCKTFFEEMYVKCLIQGNIDRTQAMCISNKITKIIDYRQIINGSKPVVQIRKLPLGEKILRVQSLNKDDPNSNVTNYFQCGINHIREYCKIELLMMIMQEPLFDKLRTQEQLGYDISCSTRVTNNVLGFSVVVKCQAGKCNVEYVDKRITKFLNTMKNDINKMSIRDFNQIKDSMKILKQQSDLDLKSEFQRNWIEIMSDEYMFDRNKKEVKSIEVFKRSDIADYFNKLIKQTSNNNQTEKLIGVQKLSIQVDGDNKGKSEEVIENIENGESSSNNSNNQHELKIILSDDQEVQHKFIQDIEAFKETLYTFPTAKQK